MTKTALDNKKNIQSHGEITTENIYRKILAKNPNDIDVWLKLFSILIAKFNFQEINFLVKKALYLNPTSLSLKKICFYALLHALKIDEANKLVESKDFMGALKADSLFLNHLYYLCLVTKITNKQVAYDYDSSVAVAGKDFRGFNHSFKFNEGSNLIDVVFYLKESFHFSIQSEIAIKLRELGVNVIFTDELWVVLYLSPKILVLSEVFHRNFGAVRALLPKALFVNTRHGLADKNYVAVGASNADIICVSSESILNLFTDNYLIDKSKIWVTGYPQMDGLFSNLLKENSTNKNARSKKVVLFAPTFTQNLNCMNLIKNQCLTKLIRGNNDEINIIIKPHPLMKKNNADILIQWEMESKDYPNVTLLTQDSINLYDIFGECDLMISDMASASLAWMATGKPLINFIDINGLENSEQFAKDGIEYKLLSASKVVDNAINLKDVVLDSLSFPSENFEKSQKFADFLFGDLRDGKASERIAKHIVNYINLN